MNRPGQTPDPVYLGEKNRAALAVAGWWQCRLAGGGNGAPLSSQVAAISPK